MRTRAAGAFAAAIVALAGASAGADTGIVLESYTGVRHEDATRLVGPVLDELTTRGYVVGYDGVGRKFEAEVSRPGRTAAGLPADFIGGIDRGHRAWVKGQLEDAVRILSPLIEAAHANAGIVAQDASVRDAVQRGLIDLALAQHGNGDPGAARETIAELLRAFPDVAISRATHGPVAFELFDSTKRALIAGGKGTLSIEVTDTSTVVFIDERYERVGSVSRTDLLPGTYRVYASAGQRTGRIYEVVVRAGAETRLTIDGGFDSVLHVAPAWTGLLFQSGDEREKMETTYAAKFARMAHANAAIVVGIDTVRGRLAVVGSLVSLHSGREIRRASVAIDPDPSTTRLRALARYLAGDDDARSSVDVEAIDEGGAVVGGDRRDPGGDPGPTTGSRWGVLRFITTGAGVAAAGVGAYLLVLDGDCKDPVTPPTPCPDVYENSTPGWALVGGGAALIGVGIYMFATNAKEAPPVAIVPDRRGGAIATVTLRF
jgi:hypothetical protein